MMTVLTDLDKSDPATEIIDNLLTPGSILPLDSEVFLSAGYNDPKWRILPGDHVHL